MVIAMWARIENGVVVETTPTNPSGRFHPSMMWAACDADVEAGWTYEEGLFVPPVMPAETSNQLCARIDDAADAARARVAGDPLRAVEYDRAADEAQAFANSGYPAEAVPRTVAAWAINGRTARQAANNILAEAAAYTEALYVIRETRLAAKEQIRSFIKANEPEKAKQLAEQTIAAISAAVAGVGNAAE